MNTVKRNQPSIGDWINALRATASLAGETSSFEHRVGPIAFLRLMGIDVPAAPAREGIDESLWSAAVDDSISTGSINAQIAPEGPIHPHTEEQAIELWTERELGALHALWRLSQIRDQPHWRTRALDAARWHLRNTQPDNATNHPWAIQVFLDLWNRDPESNEGLDARLYAETLLHNCLTTSAKPDPLSALILRDAADGLQLRCVK